MKDSMVVSRIVHESYERARDVLDWSPRISLEAGLARTIEGYRALGEAALREAAGWLDRGAPHDPGDGGSPVG